MSYLRAVYGRFHIAVLLLSAAWRAAGAELPASDPNAAVEPGNVALNFNWAEVRGLEQPALPEQTGVNTTYRLNGRDISDFLPVDCDTALWKGADKPKGGETTMVLRDGRYSQVLLRVDLSRLPREAEITRAALRFRVQGVERKGATGTFTCYLVLTPWTEEATWVKPDSVSADVWNGLLAGKDFDPQPLGSVGLLDVSALEKGHQNVEIDHLEAALKQWQSHAWANHGLLLNFNGKAIQVSVPAREAAQQARTLVAGGATNGKILLFPNEALFGSVLLRPDDLRAAQPTIFYEPVKGSDRSGTLKIYESDPDGTATGKPLASVPLKDLAAGANTLPDVAPSLRAWLTANNTKTGFLLTTDSPVSELTILGTASPHRPGLAVEVRNHPSVQLFGEPSLRPRPGVFAKVVNGHLTYRGQRLKLWGVVGHPTVDRLLKMGFNAERVWGPNGADCYTADSGKRGEFVPYQKGDGSNFDEADKHFAELKSHGLFVMLAALTGPIPIEQAAAEGSFIAGDDDWAQWKEAVTAKGAPLSQLIFVDERLQQIRKRSAKNFLTHINPYTGKAYGEDEAIAFYEIFNEKAFLERTLTSGTLAKWPPYFRQKLQRRWNDWLVQRYASDDGVRKAWGSLRPGESAVGGTVEPAPVFEARTSYPEPRADDFVEFMIGLENRFNEDFRAYCRSLFPAGVGVNVAGFSFDTLFRPNLPWAYQQTRGDIYCDCMYFCNIPSSLDKPPSGYVLDSFTPAGMPTVLYETNSARPSPYRAEYPLKLAALASRQDWDGVFWHYWQRVGGESDDLAYLNNHMDYQHTTFYWTGVEHQTDPVMCTAMALGGRIFLGGKIPPAQDPEVFQAGKKALFSYANFRGINTAAATFTKGSRVLYTPDKNSGITVNGRPPPRTGRIEEALAAGQYVTWDWPNGRLIIDAPTVKAYVGKVSGPFRFADGIELRDVSTPWISFALVSADERPLAGPNATTRAYLSGVFDAKNSSFAFDYNAQGGGPVEQAQRISDYGHEPVLIDPVEYNVIFPRGLHGSMKSYDFALRETKTIEVNGSKQVAPQGATPFMNLLEVQSWEPHSTTLPAAPTSIAKADYASLISGEKNGENEGVAMAAAGAVFPVASVDWSTPPSDAHKALRDSPLIFTSISKEEATANPEKSVVITDAQLPLLWNALADVQFLFQQDRMRKVEVTFKQPPSVEELIDVFTRTLGEPIQKKLDMQYGVTEIHWPAHVQLPDVFVTESQGVMKVIYQPPVH